MSKIKTLLPWLVAVGIFAYLFHLYPPQKIWESLRFVRLSTFIPFAVGYFFFILFVDIFSLTHLLKRFGFKIGAKELVPARGVTYLLMILNYAAGQAAFAYYLKRSHRIPLWEAFSIFFFVAFIDIYWIISLAFIGSFFLDFTIGGVELKKFVWGVAFVAYVIFVLNLFFWRGPLYKKIDWIRKKDIFRLLKEAHVSDYLQLAILRFPIHITLIVSMYVVLLTFDVSVPFLQLLGNIPLVILTGMIPITPGGFGTTNAVMVELLNAHLKSPIFDKGFITPAELLFTASLLWMFSNLVLKTIFGSICLKTVSKDLFKPPPTSHPSGTHLGQNIP